MEYINIEPAYIKGWVAGARGRVSGGKAKKKQDDTNSTVYSGYDIHMHPQMANIPL